MWHCFTVLTAKLQLELAQKWLFCLSVRLVTPGETCWSSVRSLSFPSGIENELHPADAKTCPLLSTEFCNLSLTEAENSTLLHAHAGSSPSGLARYLLKAGLQSLSNGQMAF